MQQRVVKLVTYLVLVVSIVVLLPEHIATAAPPPLTTLQPGAFRTIDQTLTINIVFVGYKPGSGPRDVNESAFRAELPEHYRTINRYASIYADFFFGTNSYLGTSFNYTYNLVYANSSFEDAFFGYLNSIATPKPLTFYQQFG